MIQPDIDFRQIRAHRGSREHGFEELCCQVASLESRSQTAAYHRKGIGADAGVECFVTDNGKETGWQAKYFFEFGASQVSQLDESIKQALAKHPTMANYIVCLPFNLRDSRRGKSQSELERWKAWAAKWVATARKASRQLKIELWDSTALLERLTRTDPLYVGRARYWFDQTLLDSVWFKSRLDESIKGLGDRYTPETNVDLPVRRALLAFARDRSVEDEATELLKTLEEARYEATDSLGRLLKHPTHRKLVIKLDQSVGAVSGSISTSSFDPTAKLDTGEWARLAKLAVSAIYKCQHIMWNRKVPKNEEPHSASYAHHALQKLSDALHGILNATEEHRWQVVNEQRLLIYGEAGVGKSHLFGDAAAHCIKSQKPAILVLGGNFIDGEPWTQILQQLGLQTLDVQLFLGALDAAAQAANTRALILIDAINERNGLDVWPTRLASFLQTVAHFPRVAIAVSCRSTYLEFIVNASLTTKQLPRIEHVGFAGRAGEAARVYLDRRGIVRMAVPNLIPEFENPLFLKTCCDFLQKEGLSEFPRGLRGVTQIFEFYFSAVAKQIERRLQLDPRRRIVAQAIEALAEAGDDKDRGYIEYKTASDLLDAILPSHGSRERNLLTQLESEGMLAVEPLKSPDGILEQFVRFTFERYSDYRAASRLLDKNLDLANPLASFAAGTVLGAYLNENDAYRHMGAIEAIAVQLPERTKFELPDVVSAENYLAREAFKKSLLWRDQTCFRQRTVTLLEELSQADGQDYVLPALLAIASEPDNRYNAYYLHKKLASMTMPQRDRRWSIFVARNSNNEDSQVRTLITWTRFNANGDIAKQRAELAAIALNWLLSTSHREIRDTATKALAALLAKRLDLAARLVRLFAQIDDSYIRDRVLASAYGGALQGLTTDGLGALAAAVYDVIFADQDITPHILIRDHARGIIEFAKVRGVLPKRIVISRVRPPYHSSWPLENVPKRKIESYKQQYLRGVHTDQIVSSTVHDGDFARYVVDSAVRHWSNLPIGAAGKTEAVLYGEWESKVTRRRPAVRNALKELVAACEALREAEKSHPIRLISIHHLLEPEKQAKRKPIDRDTKDEEAQKRTLKARERELGKAERQLKAVLNTEEWEGYRDYARAHLQKGIYSAQYRYSWPEHYDSLKIRRWVCKRAHDLGWTSDLFATVEREFDKGGRMDHRIERIGKKYQWIALHEALGHLADNVAFILDSRDKLGRYEGPWQWYGRDIDPSLLKARTFSEAWKQWAATWWLPFDINLKETSPQARLLWLDGQDDIVNGPELLLVNNTKNSTQWFVLDEYVGWHQWGLRRGETTYDRVSSVDVKSLLVPMCERDSLIKALKGRTFGGSHDLPTLEIEQRGYLGEYCWHPLYHSEEGWAPPSEWSGIPVATMPTVTTYSAEKGGNDYSIEESFSAKLPSPGLVRGLKLYLSGAQDLSYEDDRGTLAFLDPSVQEPGPSAALVEKTAFLEFLKREKLAVVWIVTARKEVFGGKQHDGGWGGERKYSSIYWLTGDGFSREDHFERKDPSDEQLKKLLTEPPEEGIPSFFRKPKVKKVSAPPPKRPEPLRPHRARPQTS
ncbi:MAG: hypothetical protein WDN02_11070 [Methylovirgula sp.]|uniref:hypothetical protein n=1 Tax=Methylovirgula sp. TaxID=1978224 RepID=UPI0030764FEF